MEGWKINPAPLLLGYYRSKFCSSARIFPRTALLADKSSSCSSRLRKAYVAANPSVFSSHLARARQSAATAASCSCSGSYQPYSVLDSRNDSERRSNSQNDEMSGGEDFGELSRVAPAEPPLNGLKPGSPGGPPYPSPGEERSHEAHFRKTGGRQSRRNEADTQNRSS